MDGMLLEAHKHLTKANELVASLPGFLLKSTTSQATSNTLTHIEEACKALTLIREGLDKQFTRHG